MKGTIATILASVLALGACISEPPTQVAENHPRKELAFVSNRDGNWEIYVMNATPGSSATRLTFDEADDFNPAWSPNGNQLAFDSNRDGNLEIYVMNADGSGQVRLTKNSGVLNMDSHPSWSPTGITLVFLCLRSSREICVIDNDGSNERQLTQNESVDDSPSWSPNGTKVAFASDRSGHYEIYVVNVDGSNETQLTYGDSNRSSPIWLRDGRIVFVSDHQGRKEIHVINSDGSNEAVLTSNHNWDNALVWSPSNSQVFIGSYTQGGVEIYAITDTAIYLGQLPFWPVWSSDGTQVAFSYMDDFQLNTEEIYVSNPDGSNQTRITENTAADRHPVWRP